MNFIQIALTRSNIPFNKIVAGLSFSVIVTAIAIAAIGLTASINGPFNVIVNLGSITHGILFGSSFFILILNLVWIASLCKKKVRLDFCNIVPQDAINTILSYLNPNELGRCLRVNQQWKRLASNPKLWDAFDLEKCFPKLRIIDELKLKKHIDLQLYDLSINDISPLNKRSIIPLLKKFSSFSIKTNAGFTLLTIPQGLTLNKLVKIAQSPKAGHVTKFTNIWPHIVLQIGDSPSKTCYRLLIANDLLDCTLHLTPPEQKKLLEKLGCKMPRMLEVALLVVLSHMIFQQPLFEDPTICLENFNGYPVTVGDFHIDQFIVSRKFIEKNDGCSGVLPIMENSNDIN